MRKVHIDVPREKVEQFCLKWKLKDLSLFGSVLREDFRADSDVDVLVTFQAGSLWDLILMEDELSALLGRKVDLVERRSLDASRNYIRRRHVSASLEEVYGA